MKHISLSADEGEHLQGCADFNVLHGKNMSRGICFLPFQAPVLKQDERGEQRIFACIKDFLCPEDL